MAYFHESARILTMSDNLGEKQAIEYGINRKIIPLTNYMALIEEIESAVNSVGQVYVIITETIHANFRANLSAYLEGFQALIDDGSMTVFEIGIDKLMDDSLSFGTVNDFVDYVRSRDRDDYVTRKEEKGNAKESEEAQVFRQLMLDLDVSKERYEKLEKDYDSLSADFERIKGEKRTLETKIQTVYLSKIERLETDLRSAGEKIRELERLIILKDKLVKEYTQDINDFRSENTELKLQLESMVAYKDEIMDERNSLNGKISSLERTINKLEKEKNDIYLNRVDGEEFVKLSNELSNERKTRLELEDKLSTAQRDLKSKDLRLKDYEQEIIELRADNEVREGGRSLMLDRVRFASVDVFYIKVVHELPYTKKLLGLLFNRLQERYGQGERSHVCIIRQDDGLEDVIYEEFPLYGTLADVNKHDEMFRLYPSRKMFTGSEEFDKKVKFLFVLDYVRSKDYYIETDGKLKYATMVHDSVLVIRYGLKGSPISLSMDSILDVRYSSEIASTVASTLREKLLLKRVDACVKELGF